jgi:hypothetical protein
MQNHMLTPKGAFQSVLANHVGAEKYQSKANLSLQHWQLWCVYIQPGLHIPKHLSFELWWTIQWLHLPCAILWSLVLYLQFQHSHLKVKTSVLEHQLQNSSDSPLSWGGSEPATRFIFPNPLLTFYSTAEASTSLNYSCVITAKQSRESMVGKD